VRIERRIVVPGAPDHVWLVLWDVERLAGCVPGCTNVHTVTELSTYTATVAQRVGPFSVSFPLTIVVLEAEPPRLIRLEATGIDRRVASRLKATLELSLAPVGPAEATAIDISAEVIVTGKLGSLGQAVIARKADENIAAFAAALAQQLNAPQLLLPNRYDV
jgi:carbon monoxide dehydrogenase subunit G